MKRAIWLTVLGLLAFGAIVVARLPAAWVVPGSGSDVACGEVDGTIWSGTCTGLTAYRQPVGDLQWELHPARLLSGKLNAAVVLTRPTGTAQATVEVGLDKAITARDVVVELPLEPTFMQNLPPDMRNVRGNIHAELVLVKVAGNVVKALQGHIEARNLEQGGSGGNARPLGSYSLTFPPIAGDEPVGQLHDLGGGPLKVEGTVRITPEPGFDLQGFVTPGPTTPPDLAKEIQYLGSPDAQGRRPFALSATF